MRRDEIPTPALVVDLPAMERNLKRMADYFADGGCKVRPHFKYMGAFFTLSLVGKLDKQ